MCARYALIEAILQVRTFDAAVAALGHVQDCLRLCRGDNLGVRYAVPTLLLRMGREQECYDFVKRWATKAGQSAYDLADLDKFERADVLESPQYLCSKYLEQSPAVAVTLLKIRLLLAIRQAGSSSSFADLAILLASSPIFARIVRNAHGDRERVLAEVVEILKTQLHMLYQAIEQANGHFWPALIGLGKHGERYEV